MQAVVQLDFSLHRGNSPKDMARHKRAGMVERDLDLVLENQKTYYVTTLKFGSTKQEVEVLVDTGSSDLWVPAKWCSFSSLTARRREFSPRALAANAKAATSAYAYTSSTCGTSYGSYETLDLMSVEVNETADAFYASYGDGSWASGRWVNDDVQVQNLTVEGLTFAVANTVYEDLGVFGIGLKNLETTNHASTSYYASKKDDLYTYDNFPALLKTQGAIKHNAYSIALGKGDYDDGSILFGAIDHSKYTGPLQKVQMLNRFVDIGYPDPVLPEIILDSISGHKFSKEMQASVMLDTGSTLTYLPQEYVEKVAKHLSGELKLYIYSVDCSLMTLTELITFTFSGIDIPVPVSSLVLQSSTYLDNCYLGMIPTLSSVGILGDNFLQNVYTVFDLDNYEIALAAASNTTSPSSVEEITSGIPGATEAPNYSSTSLSVVLGFDLYSNTIMVTRTLKSQSTSSSGSSKKLGATRTAKVGVALVAAVAFGALIIC